MDRSQIYDVIYKLRETKNFLDLIEKELSERTKAPRAMYRAKADWFDLLAHSRTTLTDCLASLNKVIRHDSKCQLELISSEIRRTPPQD